MLKLSIKNPTTQETETYDVATEFNQFFNQAKAYGLINSIVSLRVNATRDENAPIRLHADSDVGNGLLSILDGDDSLYDVRVIDEEISDVPEEHREYLESNLVNEQYSDVDELFNDIKATTKFFAPVKMSFFCPLAGSINDHEGDYYEADGAILTDNIDKIEDAIMSEQARELKMGEYISDHADIKGKVLFAEWGVEEHRGALYGRIDCYLTEELSPEETERLKDAITGQNSDGLGEGFEQREIHIDEGVLYVSYWQSNDEYFLHTEDEFDEYLSQAGGMRFGG